MNDNCPTLASDTFYFMASPALQMTAVIHTDANDVDTNGANSEMEFWMSNVTAESVSFYSIKLYQLIVHLGRSFLPF